MTLVGTAGHEKARVCLKDGADGSSCDISVEAHLALDSNSHPFVYQSLRTVDDQDRQLMAA